MGGHRGGWYDLTEGQLYAIKQAVGDYLASTPGATAVKAVGDGNYAPLAEAVHAVAASGAAQTIDLAAGTIHDITLNAACTITLPTPSPGRSFTVRLTQDGTGGRTVTWSGSVKWPGGAAATLTATANAVDLVSFVAIDGTSWIGLPAGYDIR